MKHSISRNIISRSAWSLATVLMACVAVHARASEEPAEVIFQRKGSGMFRSVISKGLYYDLGLMWEHPSWSGEITVTATSGAEEGRWIRSPGHVGARLELRGAGGRLIPPSSRDARSQRNLRRYDTVNSLLAESPPNRLFSRLVTKTYISTPGWITGQFGLERDFGVDGSKESFTLMVTPLVYRVAQDGVHADLVELPTMVVRLPADGGIPAAHYGERIEAQSEVANVASGPPKVTEQALPSEASKQRKGSWLTVALWLGVGVAVVGVWNAWRKKRARGRSA